MKAMFVTALILVFATSALAVVDPQPNTLGIYLDTEAENYCVEGLAEAMTVWDCYLIITNPTFDSIQGFEAGFYFDGVAMIDNVILDNPDAVDTGGWGNHMVSYPAPVPTSEVTQLARIVISYWDFEYGPAILRLQNASLPTADLDNMVAIDGNGDPVLLRASFDNGSTIRINAGCEPVVAESMTFDSVKSLYR